MGERSHTSPAELGQHDMPLGRASRLRAYHGTQLDTLMPHCSTTRHRIMSPASRSYHAYAVPYAR